MATLTETFEGVADGVALTTSNTAFQTVVKGSTSTIEADTARAAHGSVSALFTAVSTTSTTYMGWTSGISANAVYAEVYVYLTAVPTQDLYLLRINNGAGSRIVSWHVTAAGTLRLSNAGTLFTSAASVPINQWVRLAIYIGKGTTTGDGTIIGAFYLGDSATPVETAYSSTTANAGTVVYTSVYVGKPNNGTYAGSFWIDDPFYDDAPASAALQAPRFGGASVTAVTATATGAVPVPTVTGGSGVTAVAVAATGAVLAPTVTAAADVAALPATATATVPAPTVTGGSEVAAATATATGQTLAPTVTGGADVAAATAIATGDIPTHSATGAATVAATQAAAAGAVQPPAVTGGASITATTATASGQIWEPAVGGSSAATVAAATATATGSVLPPTVTGGAAVQASAVTGTATVLTPGAAGGAGVTAQPAAATAAILAPSMNAGATVSASTATATGQTRTPTISGGATVLTVTITASGMVYPPTVTGAQPRDVTVTFHGPFQREVHVSAPYLSRQVQVAGPFARTALVEGPTLE